VVRVELARARTASLPLEEYVEAAVLSEVAPAAEDTDALLRMYEVQAIIARTYALANLGRHDAQGFDLCATTHCQLVEPSRRRTSRWAALASRAADRTRGVVLLFEGAPALTFFHADCGGHTSAVADVWGGPPRPYLRALADSAPGSAHAHWEFAVGVEPLRQALNADPETAVGRRLDAVVVQKRDSGGRALELALVGERRASVSGAHLRTLLSRTYGVRSIRSSRFDVSRRGGTVVFSGTGFGHGVGLCQAGALARARAGVPAETILSFYYPGTRLSSRR
jgi:stage II sporulation protein D